MAELKGLAKSIPNQAILINAIAIREAQDSSEIENIITSTDELYVALTTKKGHVTSQTKEVANYRRAIFMAYELIKKQGFLRVNDIVDIQRDLLQNNAGLRSTPGTVLINDTTGEVVYTPLQERQEIDDLLSNFIHHFNAADLDSAPLINLAILHCQFESIHPFYGGNGRTGRILNVCISSFRDVLKFLFFI